MRGPPFSAGFSPIAVCLQTTFRSLHQMPCAVGPTLHIHRLLVMLLVLALDQGWLQDGVMVLRRPCFPNPPILLLLVPPLHLHGLLVVLLVVVV